MRRKNKAKLVVTSSKITVRDGVIRVVCPECGDTLPLLEVGLRTVNGVMRNQPWCAPCRSTRKEKPRDTRRTKRSAT